MSPRVSRDSSLDDLRKEAKRWLKALRDGDAAARDRYVAALGAAEPLTLRQVQLALARELGFEGWAALRRHAESAAAPRVHGDELLHRFLDNACPDHHVRGGPDHLRARHTALRLLLQHPDLAGASFASAVVCGDLERVAAMLRERPELAREKAPGDPGLRAGDGGSGDLYRRTGPKGWEPLLHLCFARLPLPAAEANAVRMAQLLLDHGADPNAYFMAGGSRYTPLVGVVGEGEEDRPPHPRRDELVALLLERGAEPYDMQVVYNLYFHGRALWFLQAIHRKSLELSRARDWDDPEWHMLDMGGYGTGARWHLAIAVRENDLDLARWCLDHGANPNSPPARDPRQWQGSLYEDAMRRGHTAIAELLLARGAPETTVALTPEQAFVTACLRMDRPAAAALLAETPALAGSPEAMFRAAKADRADVVALLLDLGVSPDVANGQNERGLHMAGYGNSVRVGRLLIDRGAEIDPVEKNWGNTPMGAAIYSGSREMIELLAPHSRNVWSLAYTGQVDRLRAVLEENPEKARVVSGGFTPLMWLPPDDEDRAIAVAELLLAHGADPSLRNEDGMTAADRARSVGMDRLAARLL